MTERAYNVLFLCTGNSARSILAESILRHWANGRFAACSAGSHPKGAVHPYALDLLRSLKLPTAGLRSKSWDEFAREAAPRLDFIFTVCDNAAGEVCPIWPGHPASGHWGVADPGGMEGTPGETAAFDETVSKLRRRIEKFLALPLTTLDASALKRRLNEIGEAADDAGR